MNRDKRDNCGILWLSRGFIGMATVKLLHTVKKKSGREISSSAHNFTRYHQRKTAVVGGEPSLVCVHGESAFVAPVQ